MGKGFDKETKYLSQRRCKHCKKLITSRCSCSRGADKGRACHETENDSNQLALF